MILLATDGDLDEENIDMYGVRRKREDVELTSGSLCLACLYPSTDSSSR